MPKGFNQKAIEGFTQWMTAVLEENKLNKKEAMKAVKKTETLLNKGFPKVRE